MLNAPFSETFIVRAFGAEALASAASMASRRALRAAFSWARFGRTVMGLAPCCNDAVLATIERSHIAEPVSNHEMLQRWCDAQWLCQWVQCIINRGKALPFSPSGNLRHAMLLRCLPHASQIA